ncbi:hypothetical protein HGRIS_011495 [Hohenbuehelia grisea]|uniref:Uncharacterized protein n=1 Tax=Hohenbuehelia grisea TaxID=104357 RepID=A0ABR3JX02_9AGAR
MATLTRSRADASTDIVGAATNHGSDEDHILVDLEANVPTPFPRADHERLRQANQPVTVATSQDELLIEIDKDDDEETDASSGIILGDLEPSIVAVQQSCITTLTDLLSSPAPWSATRTDRRHSMPPQSPVVDDMSHGNDHDEASTALQALVTNLRNRENDLMIETRMSPRISDSGDTHLLNELRTRVDALAPTLVPSDAVIAQSIVTLLAYFHRLTFLQSQSRPRSSIGTPGLHPSSSRPSQLSRTQSSGPSTSNGVDHPLDALKRQLSDLQTERLSAQPLRPQGPPVIAVETALLWSRIDHELESMMELCRERTEGLPRFSSHHAQDDNRPPEYTTSSDYNNPHDLDKPPEYEHAEGIKDSHLPREASHASGTSLQDEKMRHDLESVTRAIDRLYAVAPQLHNQRVELKSSKMRQMELARSSSSAQDDILGEASVPVISRTARGKQREQMSKNKGKNKLKDMGMDADGKSVEELERMLDLIGRASSRSMTNQTVVLAQGVSSPLAKATAKDIAQREALLAHLIEHSDSGRLHEQEAELHPHHLHRTNQSQETVEEYNVFGDIQGEAAEKERDPHTLLTLPEFIREMPPPSSLHVLQEREREVHMHAMLSLPEFIREPPPPRVVTATSTTTTSSTPSSFQRWHRKNRNRSLSAPSLSWLRPSSSGGSHSKTGPKIGHKTEPEADSSSSSTSMFEVSYVAENHETLQHILVFLTVASATPGVDIEAEVVPSFHDRPRTAEREQTPDFDDSLASGSSPMPKPPTTPNRLQIKLPGSPRKKPTTAPKSSRHSAALSGSFVLAPSDRLVIKSGVLTSRPLSLPGRTAPGKKAIQVQSGHFEIKLSTALPPAELNSDGSAASEQVQVTHPAQVEPLPLLDAMQLMVTSPTSFICASCSLPIVNTQASPSPSSSPLPHTSFEASQGRAGRDFFRYRDLPSEHWQELVDAWMCHPDQKLHDKIIKHAGGWVPAGGSSGGGVNGSGGQPAGSGGGFWPGPREALVGGSYILFGEDAIVKGNVCPPERNPRGGDWMLVRCLCGAVIGRCQTQRRQYHHFARQMLQRIPIGTRLNADPPPLVDIEDPFAEPGTEDIPAVYRLLKFAIRPVSHTAEPVKIPLSAFIVEDMSEFVNAHATYRFIVFDEEDEKPRILMWLFKPSIRIAYSMPAAYAIPKSASINAAKVLYKLLGPAESSGDLGEIVNKVPGFPQAEYLYYPMHICRRLAGILAESNRCYPESMRKMTGLDVGFLRRA